MAAPPTSVTFKSPVPRSEQALSSSVKKATPGATPSGNTPGWLRSAAEILVAPAVATSVAPSVAPTEAAADLSDEIAADKLDLSVAKQHLSRELRHELGLLSPQPPKPPLSSPSLPAPVTAAKSPFIFTPPPLSPTAAAAGAAAPVPSASSFVFAHPPPTPASAEVLSVETHYADLPPVRPAADAIEGDELVQLSGELVSAAIAAAVAATADAATIAETLAASLPVAPLLVETVKHSWKGSYPRLMRVSAVGIETLTPLGGCLTNHWRPAQVGGAEATPPSELPQPGLVGSVSEHSASARDAPFRAHFVLHLSRTNPLLFWRRPQRLVFSVGSAQERAALLERINRLKGAH